MWGHKHTGSHDPRFCEKSLSWLRQASPRAVTCNPRNEKTSKTPDARRTQACGTSDRSPRQARCRRSANSERTRKRRPPSAKPLHDEQKAKMCEDLRMGRPGFTKTARSLTPRRGHRHPAQLNLRVVKEKGATTAGRHKT